jgi:hypothetical protein
MTATSPMTSDGRIRMTSENGTCRIASAAGGRKWI